MKTVQNPNYLNNQDSFTRQTEYLDNNNISKQNYDINLFKFQRNQGKLQTAPTHHDNYQQKNRKNKSFQEQADSDDAINRVQTQQQQFDQNQNIIFNLKNKQKQKSQNKQQKFEIKKKETYFNYIIPQYKASLIQISEKYKNQTSSLNTSFFDQKKKQKKPNYYFGALSNPNQQIFSKNDLNNNNNQSAQQSAIKSPSSNARQKKSISHHHPKNKNHQVNSNNQVILNPKNYHGNIWKMLVSKQELLQHYFNQQVENYCLNKKVFTEVDFDNKDEDFQNYQYNTLISNDDQKYKTTHQSSFKTPGRNLVQKLTENKKTQPPGPGQYEYISQFQIKSRERTKSFSMQKYQENKTIFNQKILNKKDEDIGYIKKKIHSILGDNYSNISILQNLKNENFNLQSATQIDQTESDINNYSFLQTNPALLLSQTSYKEKPYSSINKQFPGTQNEKGSYMFRKNDKNRFGSNIYPIVNQNKTPGPAHYNIQLHTIENKKQVIQEKQQQKKMIQDWLNNNSNNKEFLKQIQYS